MKAKKKAKKKERLLFKDVFIIQPNWADIEDYTEEEIEDMLEENDIPEISYIDMIEKPEEIRFD